MTNMAFLLIGIVSVFQAGAAIVEKTVKYEQGGAELEGYHAYDDELEGKRPGVLITHQWTGLSDYQKLRARMLTEMGFNVFAADVYGKGVRPQPPESGEVAGKYKKDRKPCLHECWPDWKLKSPMKEPPSVNSLRLDIFLAAREFSNQRVRVCLCRAS